MLNYSMDERENNPELKIRKIRVVILILGLIITIRMRYKPVNS